jgi:Putative transposase
VPNTRLPIAIGRGSFQGAIMVYYDRLGQYTHRVAITNHRIVGITDSQVIFSLKDYKDQGRQKITRVSGEEFLRRFCMHISPRGFVKIHHYGIYSLRFLATVQKVMPGWSFSRWKQSLNVLIVSLVLIWPFVPSAGKDCSFPPVLYPGAVLRLQQDRIL